MYDGIKVYKINSKQEKTFVVWFNPEKLIHLILQKTINASLTGDAQDLFSLVNYDVLYVGRTNNMHWRHLIMNMCKKFLRVNNRNGAICPLMKFVLSVYVLLVLKKLYH